jgi:hypothetical protein
MWDGKISIPLPSQKWAYLVKYWEAVTSCTSPPPTVNFVNTILDVTCGNRSVFQ